MVIIVKTKPNPLSLFICYISKYKQAINIHENETITALKKEKPNDGSLAAV